jgi:probable F420-dependent oxidoreductase
MKFGVALPTAGEGIGFPIGFATPETLTRIAERAEELGFYAVMPNEHLCTPRAVREESGTPPAFYEPLIALAYSAARTRNIRLMTGLIVLPLREPVLLAKQITTLDHYCDGRLILGVGAGIYRDELEASLPRLCHASRGDLVDEGLEALHRLLNERAATFKGRYHCFEDVELHPKAKQQELPIFVAGNTDRAIRRAARYGRGWMSAGLGPAQIVDGRRRLGEYAREDGREHTRISTAVQLAVCLGQTQLAAEARLKTTKVWQQWTTVGLRGVTPADLIRANLIGPAEEICKRVAALEQSGVDHLAGLIFPGRDVNEVLEQMEEFAGSVMTEFPDR